MIVDVEVKLVPMRVSVKSLPPAIAEAGLRLEITGADGLTVKVAAGETPPVVLTVMEEVLTVVIMLAGTTAVSCDALL